MKRKWPGAGYIRREKDGSETWVIERQVGGRRYHVSTRCHSERAAEKHLERFEKDPAAYEREMKEGPAEPAGGLRITAALVDEFAGWLTSRDRPTTKKYAREMRQRLGDWLEDLGARDLRRLDLATLKAAVAARKVGRQHRIIAIKIFCAWLRQEKGLLERKEDVTLDLAVPQANPEKHRRRKAVPVERVRAVLSRLAPAYRDCLLLLAHTGWHVSELERFVRTPEARIAPGGGNVLAVLQVLHKTGATTRTPVLDEAALEAAKRLKARGEVPRKLNAAVKSACEAAELPRDEWFTLGVMRHSVATWAIEAGTSAEVVAEFLNHKSKSTTLRFYADVAVPTLPVRLPKLT